MRLQEIVRDSEGEGDGQFASKENAGKEGFEQEHRIILNPVEKALINSIVGMENAESIDHANAYFADAVIMLTTFRAERARKLSDPKLRP